MSRERAPAPSNAELPRVVGRRLLRLSWIANAVGVLVVFQAVGFLIPSFTDPDDRFQLGLVNAPLVAVVAFAGTLAFTRAGSRAQARALAWLVEERPPTEEEHRATLRLPLVSVKLVALAWAIGAVVFAGFNAAVHSLELGAVVGATIWLGGETTSAVVYLASERILRPVTACALAIHLPAKPDSPGVRDRLLFAWALGTGVPLLGVVVVGVVGIVEPGVEARYVAAAVAFLGLVATVVGLLATTFAAKAIAEPITSVRAGLERIARGDLDGRVEVDDASEIGLLQAGFNRMTDGLRERERIRDLFGRQVGEDVAHAALRDGVRLGGEEREVGALFVDLVGSTSIAVEKPPSEVVRLLNRFFRAVVEVVESEGGLVNKFAGDGALCVFGAPVPRDDPPATRCAARACSRRGPRSRARATTPRPAPGA